MSAGAGLQVDRGASSNTRNVYVPPSPPSTHGEGYPYRSPPFFGTWENPIGMGVKKKKRVYNRDGLPQKITKECGIINLDDIQGAGTHWVCYRNLDSVVGSLPVVEYFDPFGLVMPYEALEYFRTARKKIVYSIDEIQNRSTVLCGYWCLYYLCERQRGNRILDIIPNPHFDNDNSDFIKEYHS
ncbi:unnamed protein product [Porites evermanni]|uniref:Uncharacterized protein n=1 Tax=Porites evermanni TaxID=104178 RepID=A0ABN8R134_9CNID|nr:unnamed protein product [Porites evermanni]